MTGLCAFNRLLYHYRIHTSRVIIVTKKSLTYRTLFEELKGLTEEELDKPVVVYSPDDECYFYSVKLKGNGSPEVLDEGYPVLVAMGYPEE